MAKLKNRLNDKTIRRFKNAGLPFEKADGDGLWIRMREGGEPVFRFRYRYARKARVMVLGNYGEVSLARARSTVERLRGELSQKVDIAKQRQVAVLAAAATDAARANVFTVNDLADAFLKQYSTKTKKVRDKSGKLIKVKVDRWKHPEIVRARFDKDIRHHLGSLAVDEVKAWQVQEMLNDIVKRGASTTANDVLRWTRRLFDYAINQDRTTLRRNPAAGLTDEEAGGEELARERFLERDELAKFFEAMRTTPGLSPQNTHTFKLLLLLAVRKTELTSARLDEFDLDAGMWTLPADRTKTGVEVDIPLPPAALKSLRELVRLGRSDSGEDSDYLLPARKAQDRMLPHIHENTLNVALSKIRRQMPGVEHFHVHDLRRTARTHLQKLKVDRFIAERCLNHKIKGVEGIYGRHDYFDERRAALCLWADLLTACEAGTVDKWWAAFEKRTAVKS